MTIFRTAILFVAFFFTATGVRAQGVEWGISAGVSFHGHTFDEPLPWWDTAGRLFPSFMLHAGAPMNFVEGPLGNILFFSTGLRYTRLGSRVDWETEVSSTGQVFTGAFKISQHYLALPIQLRLHLGRMPVFLLGGPEFGFLILAQKKSDTFTPEEFSSSQTENVREDIRPFNVSLYGGLGVLLKKNAKIYLRYGVGLNKAKKEAERTVLNTDWSTREIEFGVQLPVFGVQ